jgi:glycosyltransferase involved in cell wall biosynthesis
MIVLQVLQDYLPDHVGGVQVHSHQLARVLSGRGHSVHGLYTRRDQGADEGSIRERDLDGIPLLEVVHQREYKDVETSWQEERAGSVFQTILERVRPDVVHFQHFASWGLGCLTRARAAGCATVVTLHDYFLLCDRTTLLDADGALCSPTNTRRCTSCLSNHPFHATRWEGMGETECHSEAMIERLAYHRHHMRDAQRVIVPSMFLANVMQGAELLSTGQLVHLKAGYPGPLRATRAPDANAPLRVGFVGVLDHPKGVHVLIEAMHLLRGEPIELAIHGPLASSPQYVAELRAAAAGYPISFKGRFDSDDVDRVMADLDVLVAPSLWYESMPLTIHEAWRNGLPVVASDLGGMGECVTHGVNGLLFPPGDASALADALHTLTHDRALASRLANGRPVLQTVESVAQSVEELYADCIAESQKGLGR